MTTTTAIPPPIGSHSRRRPVIIAWKPWRSLTGRGMTVVSVPVPVPVPVPVLSPAPLAVVSLSEPSRARPSVEAGPIRYSS